MNFKIKLERDEGGMYVATVPSLKGCISQGKTEKDALKNIKEAIELYLFCLADDGLPIKENARTKQRSVTVKV